MSTAFTLLEDPTAIRIVSDSATITLNRSTGFGATTRKSDAYQPKQTRTSQILGVLGLVKLRSSSYIVCATGAVQVGLHLNYPVWMVKKISIVKFKTYNTKESDKSDIRDIFRFFRQPGYYYSEYPIYKSYVDQNYNEIDFLFNHKLIEAFEASVKGNPSSFVLRCMQGYFGTRKTDGLTVSLVSRRCWKRAGLRYFSRGCDSAGYPSNFVETEQVLFDGENIISFLQVRGSIPLKWGQRIEFKINPDIYVKDTENIVAAHEIFSDHYGDVFYLNLIQHINQEKTLNDAFKKELYKGKYEFLNFDFKNQNMEKCLLTRDKFIKDLDYLIDRQGMSINADEEQTGIIRTNCIDCLDRTNVVQFLIALEACKRQILRMGQLAGHQGVEELSHKMLSHLKELWFENGNMLSIQYSGTPSLKSTIIKGGNQTGYGRLKDGYHSLKRYYLNRFSHGNLQNGYDLLTGNSQKMEHRKRFRLNISLFLLIMAAFIGFLVGKFNDRKYEARSCYIIFTALACFFSFYRLFFDYFVIYPSYVEK